jgi:prolyl-tRNA synthetase
MGSYGIGPARIVAAAVEQRADELGICWPPAIAPWRLHVCSLGKQGDEVAAAADELYEACLAAGIETLLDDRPGAGPGEKLTDAELLGCPLRVTVGRRGIAEGVVEARVRASGEEERIPLAEAPSRVGEILEGIS